MLNNLLDKWGLPTKDINIAPCEIHVWMASLRDLSHYLTLFYSTLSKEEVHRAGRFKFDEDRNDFIISRGVLRNIISNYLFISPSKIKISYYQYGKPYLAQSSIPLYFNLSHSNGLALYIFSDRFEVGIDIEKIVNIDNYMDIAKSYFSKNEVLKLNVLPKNEQLLAFFNCWTKKEAYVKALGYGLNLEFNSFEVPFLPCDHPKILINNPVVSNSDWSLYSISTTSDYEAALAFQGMCRNIRLWHFTKPLMNAKAIY